MSRYLGHDDKELIYADRQVEVQMEKAFRPYSVAAFAAIQETIGVLEQKENFDAMYKEFRGISKAGNLGNIHRYAKRQPLTDGVSRKQREEAPLLLINKATTPEDLRIRTQRIATECLISTKLAGNSTFLKFIKGYDMPDGYRLLLSKHFLSSLYGYMLIQEGQPMGAENGRTVMNQLFNATAFMHSKGIAHRNLCLKSILCNFRCVDAPLTDITITDFDSGFQLAEAIAGVKIDNFKKIVRKRECVLSVDLLLAEKAMIEQIQTKRKNQPMTPPHVVLYKYSDMYNLGAIMHQLLTAEELYVAGCRAGDHTRYFIGCPECNTTNLYKMSIANHAQRPNFKSLSPNAQTLITSLVEYLPDRRMTAREACSSAWIRNEPEPVQCKRKTGEKIKGKITGLFKESHPHERLVENPDELDINEDEVQLVEDMQMSSPRSRSAPPTRTTQPPAAMGLTKKLSDFSLNLKKKPKLFTVIPGVDEYVFLSSEEVKQAKKTQVYQNCKHVGLAWLFMALDAAYNEGGRGCVFNWNGYEAYIIYTPSICSRNLEQFHYHVLDTDESINMFVKGIGERMNVRINPKENFDPYFRNLEIANMRNPFLQPRDTTDHFAAF